MQDPIMGCGPDHWPLHAHEFGWPRGKEAHSLWVQTATELGIPGIMMFMGFYLVCIWRCWLLLGRLKADDPSWFGDSCRMTIGAICGFMVAAMFVSLEALEIPYYVCMLGAGTMVVYSRNYQFSNTSAVPDFDSEDTFSQNDPVEEEQMCLQKQAAADWRDEIDARQSQVPVEDRCLIMN
jgi:hypothetical protein